MGLESATYIDGLIATNPAGADGVERGDDHIRLLKGVLLNTFPNLNAAMTATATELNALSGKTLGDIIESDITDFSAVDHNHTGVYQTVLTAASTAEMEAGVETEIKSMSPASVAAAIVALAGAVNSDTVDGYHIWSGTQTEYDAIATPTSDTLYFIQD